MKKIITFLFILIPIFIFSEGAIRFTELRIKSIHEPFGMNIPAKTHIYVEDSIATYVINGQYSSLDSMTTVFRAHDYKRIPGGSSEYDPIYRADTLRIAYLNKKNIFTDTVKVAYFLSNEATLGGLRVGFSMDSVRNRTLNSTISTLFHKPSGAATDTIVFLPAQYLIGQIVTISKYGIGYNLRLIASVGNNFYYFIKTGPVTTFLFYDPQIGTYDTDFEGSITFQAAQIGTSAFGWIIIGSHIISHNL